jgi:plastocyanin
MSPKSKYLWIPAIVLSVALAASSSCSSGKAGNNGYPTAPPTARALDSGDFGPGATFEHTFATAGTFAYHCVHHSPMTGTVQVSDAAPGTLVNVSITSSAVPFPAASVKPGGRVVWTNNSGMVHTVTSD